MGVSGRCEWCPAFFTCHRAGGGVVVRRLCAFPGPRFTKFRFTYYDGLRSYCSGGLLTCISGFADDNFQLLRIVHSFFSGSAVDEKASL